MEHRNREETVFHEIPPLFDGQSRVLVLGSIPSPKSREQGFYYGHPRNRFWSVMAAVLGEPFPETVEARREMMLRRHIAMWDVLASCRICGASDLSIRDAEPNDLDTVLRRAPIEAVFTTGKKAGTLYERFDRYGLPHICLPSTSPANAAMKEADLVRAYGVIAERLRGQAPE